MHIRAFLAAVIAVAVVGVRPARAEGPPVAAVLATSAPAPIGEGSVNLNTATVEELIRLPGVGPAKAAAIAAFRQKHGTFSRIEDLDRVKGFGRKTLARLRPNLSLSGPTTYVGKPHSSKEAPPRTK
jgi:competence protein ComEA